MMLLDYGTDTISICLSSCFSLESPVSVSQASSVPLFSLFLYFISPLSLCFSFLFCVIFLYPLSLCILFYSFFCGCVVVCLFFISYQGLISFPRFMTPQKVKKIVKGKGSSLNSFPEVPYILFHIILVISIIWCII